MKIDLTGRTALVTGSTAGIGLAIAKGLAGAGATVIVNGRGRERVDAAVTAVGRAVPIADVRGATADVGTAEGCAALVAAEPHVDILVNNAGIFVPSPFLDTGDDVWLAHFELNLMSGVRLSRAYLPGMAERGWGRVLFLSSESAINIPVEMVHYGVTKTADMALARGLAKAMAGTGVTVNSILPGPTLSEGVEELLRDGIGDGTIEEAGKRFVEAHRPGSLIRRMATVEEVANLVVYAASEQASATTGAALRVDGGVADTI